MDKFVNAAQKRGGRLLRYKRSGKSLWQCREGHSFWLTGYKVYRRGKWCPHCGSSNGERTVRQCLQEWNLPFVPQAVLPLLPSRRYDFCFGHQGRRFLVEFDGEQHFRFVKRYHRTKKAFHESQLVDRIKTHVALISGYHLIRIDYTQMPLIQAHLINAISINTPVYYSTPQMYTYISHRTISPSELQRYVPGLFW